jgi:FdhD protein
VSKTAVSYSRILKVSPGSRDEADDLLAAEEPLEIRIGYGPSQDRQQRKISVTMRTPGNDFELALGFLYTEGIIRSREEITQIRYCTDINTIENQENIVRVELKENVPIDLSAVQRNFYTTSSCGVCGKASIDAVKVSCPAFPEDDPFTVQEETILKLPAKLREQQAVFRFTGGLHASALFDLDGNFLLAREDVGRHNALDKLIGAIAGGEQHNTSIPLNRHILLLSGRASFELMQKAAMAGIKMVCAVGAPSSLAVEMARESGTTLIGFLRDERFNVYSGSQRVEN